MNFRRFPKFLYILYDSNNNFRQKFLKTRIFIGGSRSYLHVWIIEVVDMSLLEERERRTIKSLSLLTLTLFSDVFTNRQPPNCQKSFLSSRFQAKCYLRTQKSQMKVQNHPSEREQSPFSEVFFNHCEKSTGTLPQIVGTGKCW